MRLSIKEIGRKIKGVIDILERQDIFTSALIILVAGASFGLGVLSVDDTRDAIKVEQTASIFDSLENSGDTQGNAPGMVAGKFVGSKNSDKYHYPWCFGAQRIKEENKVWFTSKKEAEAQGYAPAGNCKGL